MSVATPADRDLFDRSVLDFATYEEYLDQQVTPEDLFYLGDPDAARQIVELGYKGKDFLSREEFEAARVLALEGPTRREGAGGEEGGAVVLCGAGRRLDDAPLLAALQRREELVRSGKLATIIFLRDIVRGQEVSAYIDYGHRLKTEDFTEYFARRKKLTPRRTDLSYYNWKTHTLFYNNSLTFQVLADNEMGLLMKHKRDRKTINVDPRAPTPGDNSNRTVIHSPEYVQVTIYDHVTRRKN
ncbi:putative: flagellar/basal body protein [Trypanosoma theileri]|uniref:Cilia- and flagella-associated protein 299 n=1 Tax=Trypanosoma theileri TaxID=67003 RepID=A0A1X0NN64_9TRYP|nr:putative: flagellar/basal body protein [Trypanosoma theileri]ORC85943.1 putative: flagellar/basal body protein [Trypanosoma theileri]